jgi:hypothetical protein
MIDKIWHDWQCRDPVNANSYFGGSVEQLESLDAYYQYPNGGPPFLSVSTCQIRSRDFNSSGLDCIAEFNPPG